MDLSSFMEPKLRSENDFKLIQSYTFKIIIRESQKYIVFEIPIFAFVIFNRIEVLSLTVNKEDICLYLLYLNCKSRLQKQYLRKNSIAIFERSSFKD